MDGKGGCCIARYGDGGGSSGSGGGDGRCSAFDKSKIDRIMLRYRPIAPKPMTSGGGNSSPREVKHSTGAATVVAGNKSAKTGRGRKKYRNAATKGGANSGNSSGSSNGSGRKRKSTGSPGGGSGSSSSSSGYGERLSRSSDGLSTTTTIHEQQGDPPILPSPPPPETRVVTLPLLPESPDLAVNKQKATDDDDRRHNRNNPGPIWLNFDYYNPTATVPHKIITNPNNKIINMNYGSPPPPRVGSVVTVECITDAWMDDGGNEIGRLTDEERHMSLERDTCPGFISDGFHRVWWTNEAYKKMMMMGSIINNKEEEEETDKRGTWKENEQGGGVLVVMGEKVVTIPLNYRAFTCRVKVQYHCSNGTGTTPCDARENKKRVAMTTTTTFPCDVWRLENGNGFAWRMDVEAALSLGRFVD